MALDGRKIAGTLHRISITGGLVHLPNKLNAGTLAEVILDTTAGRVTGLVELLGPTGAAASGFHAFRFVALNDTDHDRLNGVIKHMLSLGHKA